MTAINELERTYEARRGLDMAGLARILFDAFREIDNRLTALEQRSNLDISQQPVDQRGSR